MQVLAAEPGSARGLLRAAQALHSLGHHTQAEALLQHGLRLHPGQKQLGALLHEAQQQARAQSLTQRSSQPAPVDTRAGSAVDSIFARALQPLAGCPQTPADAAQRALPGAAGLPAPSDISRSWSLLSLAPGSSRRQLRCDVLLTGRPCALAAHHHRASAPQCAPPCAQSCLLLPCAGRRIWQRLQLSTQTREGRGPALLQSTRPTWSCASSH